MPEVSVVVPVFNRAGLMAETLDSVLAQTFRDFEIIVVDDGSTDGLENVINRFQAASRTPVRFFRQANRGQGAARNLGIRNSRGRHVAFLDSDDLWLPDKLRLQVAELRARPDAGLVYSDAFVFDGVSGQDLFRYSERFPPQGSLLVCCFICSPTPLVRREVFERVGSFDETPLLRGREDWEMWLRVCARWPALYLPTPLARYRVHPGNMTGAAEDKLTARRSSLAAIERAVAFAPETYSRFSGRAVARVNLDAARALVLSGRGAQARELIAQALRLGPPSAAAFALWALSFLGERAANAFGNARRLFRSRARAGRSG